MFRYETHLHTSPVSACASADVRESLELYKELGYDGVFITNHFLDGNIRISRTESYETRLRFYFSDYEQGLRIGEEIGLRVFLGVEMAYGGTDFLVYGLSPDWYFRNERILSMDVRAKLAYIAEEGGCVVHAHPFREAGYIDHIRLYPRSIHAVEVINASRSSFENQMAALYAENYGFFGVAGSDNHIGKRHKAFAGVMTETPIQSEAEYVRRIQNRSLQTFVLNR